MVGCAEKGEDKAFLFTAMKGQVNGRPASQIGKIGLGERPTPPAPVYPANYLLFNSIAHGKPYCFCKKKYHIFLTKQRAAWEASGIIPTLHARQSVSAGGTPQ